MQGELAGNRSTPKLSGKVQVEEIDWKNGDKVFFCLVPETPSWAFLDEDGLEILNLCDGKSSVAEIASTVAEHHQVNYQDSLKTVASFLDRMRSLHILSGDRVEEQRRNEFSGIALEVTRSCNLRCVHCYLSAGIPAEHELELGEIKRLLESVKEAGGVSVAFGGGEPLMRRDCFEMLEYAASLGLLILIGTNGTLIDEEKAGRLSKLPIRIQVSLDGASKQTHDRIRGEGNFERTVRGIDNLIDQGMSERLVLAFVPMNFNFHEVPGIVEFALKRKIPVVQFPPLSPSGRARERWDELKLSNEETLRFWAYVSRRSGELRGQINLLADCFSMNIENLGAAYRCSIGSQLRVDPEGFVYPCQCFHSGTQYCLGNIRDSGGLEGIAHGPRLRRVVESCFRRPLTIEGCGDCGWRNYCGSGCAGVAFESSGTILNPESCPARRRWIEQLFQKKREEIGLMLDPVKDLSLPST